MDVSRRDALKYPQGDRTAAPSGVMPKGGWYFDAIIRQPPIEEDLLRVEENLLAMFETVREHGRYPLD